MQINEDLSTLLYHTVSLTEHADQRRPINTVISYRESHWACRSTKTYQHCYIIPWVSLSTQINEDLSTLLYHTVSLTEHADQRRPINTVISYRESHWARRSTKTYQHCYIIPWVFQRESTQRLLLVGYDSVRLHRRRLLLQPVSLLFPIIYKSTGRFKKLILIN